MDGSIKSLTAEEVDKLRLYHVPNREGSGICNCGMFLPCHVLRLVETLDVKTEALGIAIAQLEEFEAEFGLKALVDDLRDIKEY